MRAGWEVMERSGGGRLYASLNAAGIISLSGCTHEQMGSPGGYLLMFDRRRRAIGLKAAEPAANKHAYKACKRSSRNGNKNLYIHAAEFCRGLSLNIGQTIKFAECHIDDDGILVLELDTARQVRRGAAAKAKIAASRSATVSAI